jgi:hypothetical protein
VSFVDWLRKGFGFVLLSMGVSRPAAKSASGPRLKSKPTPKSDAEPAPDPATVAAAKAAAAAKINNTH